MKMMTKAFSIAAVTAVAAFSGIAFAAGGGKTDSNYKMKHPHWHFTGFTGSYDKEAAQRGYQVYREVCASCHALEHLSFRHLGDKGAPFYNADYPNPNDNPFVKAFAADWSITDIDGETGDEIERPGTPADKFPPIYANDGLARGSNGGALPPDLSVIVKARAGGADYIYNLLVAYETAMPEGMQMAEGFSYNPVFEGGAIAMAAPLSEGIIEYAARDVDDGHGNITSVPAPEATVEQMAKDVTEFLAWAADPKMEARKQTGLGAMIYLLILSILLWLSYKRVWRDVKH